MESFKLSLSNGGVVTGIYNLPPPAVVAHPVRYRPLVIGLHGGTYYSQYFDADAKHTASISSNAYGVPFVSIDRPCYGGTSSFLPVPKDSSFAKETGLWLHNYILPALWSTYGSPNDCNCIVLLCHSFGVMGGLVSAAMHAQDKTPSYPLGGIIMSGLGDRQTPSGKKNVLTEPNHSPNHVKFSLEVKDAIMLPKGTFHPEILKQSQCLDCPAPFEEVRNFADSWLASWKEWAFRVTAPVLFAIAEQDCYFEATEEHVKDCLATFRRSSSVEGNLIKHAPHCMELSYWSQAWYARCFGFAMASSASFAFIQ